MPRRNSKQLTDPGIERMGKARPGARREIFDSLAPGLALRITDQGTKSWSVYYRLDKKHKRLTLGSWPFPKVAEAREKARQVKTWAKAGINPKLALEREQQAGLEALRKELEARVTFGEVAERYMAEALGSYRSAGKVKSVIRRELLPEWKDRPFGDLRKRDAVEIINKVKERSGPAAAHLLAERIIAIGNWAAAVDIVTESPFAGLKKKQLGLKKNKRDRLLTDDVLRGLWGGCDSLGYPFGPFFRCLLLTGQRPGEVAKMRWRDVDVDKAEWIIWSDENKSERPHFVPLSPQAVDLLKGLPRFNKGDYVFTTTSGAKPVSGYNKTKNLKGRTKGPKGRLNDVTGASDWTPHDLRRTCRTTMAKLYVTKDVGEAVLNHARDGLVSVYNLHDYADEKREALFRWSMFLGGIVGLEPHGMQPSPEPTNVVHFPKAAAQG